MTPKHIMSTIIIIMVTIGFNLSSVSLFEKKIIVDFNMTNMAINLIKGNDYTILFKCTSNCSWFLPRTFKGILNNSNSETSDLIIPEFRYEYPKRLTVCSSNNHSIEYHDEQPDCCPCCLWYDKSKCNFKPPIDSTCMRIFIHGNDHHQMDFSIRAYTNAMVLIPCYLNNDYDEKINLFNHIGKQYLVYKNDSWFSKDPRFHYYPTVGFCIPSKYLTKPTYTFFCVFNEHANQVMYMVTKFDKNKNFRMKLSLKNNLDIGNKTRLRLLDNGNFTIKCSVGGFEKLVCTKFYSGNSTIPPFKCNKYRDMDLNIDLNKIKNQTKLTCHSKDASQAEQRLETTILKYTEPSFVLKESKKWENCIINLIKMKKIYTIKIEFVAVPVDELITCIPNNETNFRSVLCHMKAFYCICKYTRYEFKYYNSSILHVVKLSNRSMSYDINITFVPIFLNEPILIDATKYVMDSKLIKCKFTASKPYLVKWFIQIDNTKMTLSNQTSLELYFNKTVKYCVQCSVKNTLETKNSSKICHKLIDPYIKDNKIIEISFLNVNIWRNNKIKVIKRLQFDRIHLNNVTIIDFNLSISCASRNVKTKIQLLFNNETLNFNSSNTTSFYKQETIFFIKMNEMKNFEYNLYHKFKCQQKLRNETIEDETSAVNIVEIEKPKILPTNQPVLKFISGTNLIIEFTVFNFPISKFKCSKYEKDLVIKPKRIKLTYKQLNRTFTKVMITIINLDSKDNGHYYIAAYNLAGFDSQDFQLKEYSKFNLNLAIIITVFLLIIVSIVIACYIYHYFKPVKIMTAVQYHNQNYRSVEMDQLNILSEIWPNEQERLKWTLGHEFKLVVFDKIGSGNYGNVYKASIQRSNDPEKMIVALKEPILIRPKHSDPNNQSHNPTIFCAISSKCFVNEVKIMSKLTNNINVVKLVGCTLSREQVTYNNPTATISEDNFKSFSLLAMEYCDNQSLNEYIRKSSAEFAPFTKNRQMTVSNENGSVGNRKVDQGLTLLDLKRLALGIVNGLEYLSQLNIIHRDLATRNILIDINRVPKITDFGLAIDLDEGSNDGESYQIFTSEKPLPLKILAPESLQTRRFYLESDIWGFSLLLWEMFNLCNCDLFPSVSSIHQLRELINQNVDSDGCCPNLLQSPQYADQAIWEVIKSCWMYDYRRRPNALRIKEKLIQIIHESPVEIVRVTSGPCPYSPIIPQGLNGDSLGFSNYQGTNPIILRRNHSQNTDSSIIGENNSNILSTNTSIITLNYPSTTTSMVFNTNGTNSDRLYEEDE